MKREEVSVLFSGGSDSTLAAAFMCRQFEKVHLLTFLRSGISSVDNAKISAQRLEQKFGKDKLTHKFINMEQTFKKLYYDDYTRDFKQYGVFLVAGTCFACLLAMHTETIIYNLKNKINSACDGYKKEKEHIYVPMSKEGIVYTKELYAKYGIDYLNPVYNITRTDWELFDLGITSKRNAKFPHHQLEPSYEPICAHGVLTNAYVMAYYYPLYHKRDDRWVEYYKEKITVAGRYIDAMYARFKIEKMEKLVKVKT